MLDYNYMKLYFDRQSARWPEHPEEYGVREGLLDRMALPDNGAVADVGCGTGVMLPHLLERGMERIYAVDLSDGMLRYARARYWDQRISYVQADFYDAYLPRLDVALFYNSYPHFVDKRALVCKLASQIRPGGSVCVAHSAGRQTVNNWYRFGRAFLLSVPLLQAEEEARVFAEYFTLADMEDSEDLYFLRLERV